MADGAQSAGTAVATSSAGVAVPYLGISGSTTYGNGYNYFQISASSTNAGVCYIDITQGATVIATSSVGYGLQLGKTFPTAGFGAPKYSGRYSGFSALSGNGSATLYWIAWS